MKVFYVEDDPRVIFESLQGIFKTLLSSGAKKRAEAAAQELKNNSWALEDFYQYLDAHDENIVIRDSFESALQWLMDNESKLCEFELFIFDRNLHGQGDDYEFADIKEIDELYHESDHKYVQGESFGREGDYLLWRTAGLLKKEFKKK